MCIRDRNRLARSSVDIAARLKGMAAKTGRLQPEETGSPAKGGKPGRADYLTGKAMLQERTAATIGMGPLAPLLADPAVSDILVNAPDKVCVERFGRIERTDVRFRDADHIVRVIERIAARVGRR